MKARSTKIEFRDQEHILQEVSLHVASSCISPAKYSVLIDVQFALSSGRMDCFLLFLAVGMGIALYKSCVHAEACEVGFSGRQC